MKRVAIETLDWNLLRLQPAIKIAYYLLNQDQLHIHKKKIHYKERWKKQKKCKYNTIIIEKCTPEIMRIS